MTFDSTGSTRNYSVKIKEFNSSLLPEGKRNPRSPDYALAIHDYLSAKFSTFGGNCRIVVGPETIDISWTPDRNAVDPVDASIDDLGQGRYDEAIAILRLVVAQEPDNINALYNLGMALSDKGVLEEAIGYLEHLVEIRPSFTNALIALGVAYSRNEQFDDALESLSVAVKQDPDNPWARRNYGGMLLKSGETEESIDHFEVALKVAPEDANAWWGYGMALLELERIADADKAFIKVIKLAELTPLADMAKAERTKIAHRELRAASFGGERPDAMMYLMSAIKKFDAMPKSEVQKILMEIAIRGERGLDINDPEQKYTFRSIPGDFSGLQAVCYMYAAGKIIMPGMDVGIDLSSEYRAAEAMLGKR